jgi:hypothetical protein
MPVVVFGPIRHGGVHAIERGVGLLDNTWQIIA